MGDIRTDQSGYVPAGGPDTAFGPGTNPFNAGARHSFTYVSYSPSNPYTVQATGDASTVQKRQDDLDG